MSVGLQNFVKEMVRKAIESKENGLKQLKIPLNSFASHSFEHLASLLSIKLLFFLSTEMKH